MEGNPMLSSLLDPERSVASLVLERSECADVFLRHQIDFCCRGNVSLSVAAESRGLEVTQLLTELDHVISDRTRTFELNPATLDTARLIEHIVSKHHHYLRQVLPSVQFLAQKVGRVHGERNPKLRTLDALVQELATALLPHLDEEEQSLFPLLCSSSSDGGAIESELTAMLDDHLAVAKLLQATRAAADDFVPPDWACNSYHTLISELAHLERDVFTHIHLENHVLRPRFLAEAAPIAAATLLAKSAARS
ncbi:MAG TPA: DUF542 domain-containing protein [Polyangiaceae bacterium]|nr:DUF542 domain-containing protein [Polyangiaceae bacterium]